LEKERKKKFSGIVTLLHSGPSKGDRAGYILSKKGAIKLDGFIVGHHQWIGGV
jgi:hypothetical protein